MLNLQEIEMKKYLLSTFIMLNLAVPATAQSGWSHGSGSGLQYEGG